MSEAAAVRPSIRTRLIARTGGALLGTLMRSLRFEVATGEEHFRATVGSGVTSVVVLWHGRLLPSAFFYRHRGLATLISQHRDGDYIAGVVERWGFHAVRGSSSRGGSAALARIVELLESGTTVAITPDGPRGPREKMKSGPLRAAQRTGAPILPVSAATDRAWWVGGWDRFMIPKPFARIRMGFAEPLVVPREADAEEVARLERMLEERLSGLTTALDGLA